MRDSVGKQQRLTLLDSSDCKIKIPTRSGLHLSSGLQPGAMPFCLEAAAAASCARTERHPFSHFAKACLVELPETTRAAREEGCRGAAEEAV